MNKKIAKRLSLKTETLSKLGDAGLEKVVGGQAQSNANGNPCVHAPQISHNNYTCNQGPPHTSHTACTNGCPCRWLSFVR